jgi:2-succinyl-5-enolpyruvyl-6-hydroxy-3-cyclohexene-1-carboxylate synthase
MQPNNFFHSFFQLTHVVESTYNQLAQDIKAYRQKKSVEYLVKIPFSDLKVFEKIIPVIPNDYQLHISNSSPIRYAQLFDIEKSIEVYSNRGTSGIDGSTSTAIGAAVGNKKPCVFIAGDIGFLYDSNALWNNYIPNNFKIILINNGGGGIFRILPGHKETPVFNTFFETSHCLTAEHLAKMYGLNYLIASNEASLEKSLKDLFLQDDKPTLLEVFTPTLENDKILLDYFKALV